MSTSGIAISCEIVNVKLCNKAEQDNSNAQLLLQEMYYKGSRILQDYVKAKEWCKHYDQH